MNKELETLIKYIVKRAKELKDLHTDQFDAKVNYACIFCQSDKEYDHLNKLATESGKVIKDTSAGPLYEISPLETVAGPLRILKVRKYYSDWPERGDADFVPDNYQIFKSEYLSQPGFKLIQREDFEMIELMDSAFDVRAYFSDPPVEKQYFK